MTLKRHAKRLLPLLQRGHSSTISAKAKKAHRNALLTKNLSPQPRAPPPQQAKTGLAGDPGLRSTKIFFVAALRSGRFAVKHLARLSAADHPARFISRKKSAQSAAKIAPLLRRRDSAFAFVAGDDAVLNMHDAISVLGDVGFMRDQHNRVALA